MFRMRNAWATTLEQFWHSPTFPMWVTLAAAGFFAIILFVTLIRAERSVANGALTVITLLAIGIAAFLFRFLLTFLEGRLFPWRKASSTLAGGANCTLGIKLKPIATGLRNGTLQLKDDAGGSPQTAALKGTGS